MINLIKCWRLLLHILPLFCCIKPAFCQWSSLSSGTTTSFADVYFLNRDTGFVAGGGQIMKTTDGGQNWSSVYQANFTIVEITFFDDLFGVAVGRVGFPAEAAIFKTFDGGISWLIDTLPSSNTLLDFHFPIPSTGYAVGYSGTAFKTIDGGLTWDSINTGVTTHLYSVYFTSAIHGFAVGGQSQSLIIETNDGGITWDSVPTFANVLKDISFISDSIGFAVGLTGAILKTIDGGNSWTYQSSANNLTQNEVFILNNNLAYIVGGLNGETSIQKTEDGGNTWTNDSVPGGNVLNAIFFADPTTGYCVGNGGHIFKFKSTDVGLIELDRDFKIYPNPVIDYITLDIKELKATEVIIVDVQGRQVFFESVNQPIITLDLADLKNGIYFLTCRNSSFTKSLKIVKSK